MREGSRRVSTDSFLRETTHEHRSALREQLNTAIAHFLSIDRPVYLDGLGILAPTQQVSVVRRELEGKQVVREEKVKSVQFEKCYECMTYHRQKYQGLVELRELIERIYPRLPFTLQIKWPQPDTRRLLRGLLKSIRDEVIVDGSSEQLKVVGTLFSLHNRQGENIEDWFAGADVFLKPCFQEIMQVGASRVYEMPILQDSWELLEAAYGAPVDQFEIDLSLELAQLGYDSEAFRKDTKPDGEKHCSLGISRTRWKC